ncbi:MAG: PAS domain-containing protein [Deltaproteobacteria bacterium]|nr:PAS domain-containing protein [Deltaproteobacteria bacterium]
MHMGLDCDLVIGVSRGGQIEFLHPLPLVPSLFEPHAVGPRTLDDLQPHARDAFNEALQAVLLHHAPQSFQVQLKQPARLITIKAVARLQANHVLGVTFLGQCIEEEAAAAPAAPHPEQMLASLLRDVDIGIMLFGPNAEILHANAAALDILGISQAHALASSSYDPQWAAVADNGEPLPGEKHPVPTAIRTRTAIRNVTMGVRTPGRDDHVWLSVSAVPELDGQGRVTHVVCSFNDITTRRDALLRLRRETDLLSEVMNASVAGICVLDPTGNITYANRAAEEILGLNKTQIVGRSYDAPEWRATDLEGNPWPDDRQPFVRVMKTKAPVMGVEHAILWPDGRRRALSINGAPVLNAQGEIERLVFAVIDITEQHRTESERRRMEAQMQQIARIESLSVLAGGVAHDFNNLLAGVLGSASLALEVLDDQHPATQHVRLVELAAQSAAQLTRQLLAYSGRGRFVVRKLDIESVLRQMDQLLRALVGKSIDLRLELTPDLPSVEGDQTQIQQIVMNLVINAAEAMGGRGAIVIRTGRVYLDEAALLASQLTHDTLHPGPYVFIEVADTGPGMPAEVLSHIFDPFFTTKEKGHGLGLAAVLGIMKGHQGRITVQSEVGVGTTFKLAFPDRGKRDETVHTTQGTPAFSAPGKVLIIDDEPFVRTLIERILQRKGCETIAAADGAHGLELFFAHKDTIAAVLLDLSMPGMNGTAVLEQIRKAAPQMPVLLMSGYYEDDAAMPARDEHCTFIQKPFAPNSLLHEMQNLLNRGSKS